jgi:hypothetical protein
MEHLFEPFHPGARRREGLGLGLYIVEQIVRAHGGIISAASSEASGTTFTVRWPRNTPTSAPTACTSSPPAAELAGPRAGVPPGRARGEPTTATDQFHTAFYQIGVLVPARCAPGGVTV